MQKGAVRGLIYLLRITAVVLVVYLLFAPFFVELKYRSKENEQGHLPQNKEELENIVDTVMTKEFQGLPQSEYSISKNRLIIPKINVNAPIVESENEKYGLSRGAWRMPNSSTPDKPGNTIITGHRFKYLPPNNVTFYLFHKLEEGDLFTIIWNEERISYKIREIKIVKDTEVSILDQSEESIVTLFTCDPIYSTKNRLVVVAEKI